VPECSSFRLANVSASGESTNLLPASVSALTCHQPTGDSFDLDGRFRVCAKQ
jgi:hypothetical protein